MVKRALRSSHAVAVAAVLIAGWAVGAFVGAALPAGAGTCDR